MDRGNGLDSDCTYYSGGPLLINITVPRVVGDVAKLKAAHYISPMAHLRLPAFDVDMFGDPADSAAPPEVDRVTFNGHDLGTLTGDNDIWKLNEFTIPIEWINFPSAGADGVAPIPGDNELRIDIDTYSGGDDNWCTSVDWAELDFDAIAPIFLVHGILSNGSAAWPNFHTAFTEAGIPFSDSINLPGRGTIEGNAVVLAQRLTALATSLGARKCHIIAHSKGGLDSRAYLNGTYNADRLRVLSLYTVSTPHHGTVIADMGIAVEEQLPTLSLTRLFLTRLLPFVADLSTSSMAAFNARYPTVPTGVLAYAVGADADGNSDKQIDTGEAIDLPAGLSKPAIATYFYQTLATEATMRVTSNRPTIWGDTSGIVIDVMPTSGFAKNDVLVSTASATAPFGTYLGDRVGNHTTVKSTDLARTILQQIIADYPNR